jgi:hypothetical protein
MVLSTFHFLSHSEYPHFMEPDGSSPCPQQPTASPYCVITLSYSAGLIGRWYDLRMQTDTVITGSRGFIKCSGITIRWWWWWPWYVVGSNSSRPDIQKPRQMKIIELLVYRYEKCVEVKADCTEKYQSFFKNLFHLEIFSGRKRLHPTTYLQLCR